MKYKVINKTGAIIPKGILLNLTSQQYSVRKNSLKKLKKNFEVIEDIQFKENEIIDIIENKKSTPPKFLNNFEKINNKPIENNESKTLIDNKQVVESSSSISEKDISPLFSLKEVDKDKNLFVIIDEKDVSLTEPLSKEEAEKQLDELLKEE